MRMGKRVSFFQAARLEIMIINEGSKVEVVRPQFALLDSFENEQLLEILARSIRYERRVSTCYFFKRILEHFDASVYFGEA